MFSNELKESTMRVHQGLEKRLVAQIKSIETVDDYISLLELMYGFYAPIQNRLQPFLAHQHRQANHILADINYLTGSPIHNIPVSNNLPAIHSYPAALGALYVTEGSTLGGVIIADMITQKLDMPATKGFSFFNAYGKETQSRWQKFKEILNGPFAPYEKEEMKQAAIATFSTFNEWISEYKSASHK
jgi:heme oxygenase